MTVAWRKPCKWSETVKSLKEQFPDAHFWYSIELGWCFITDGRGVRHRIDTSMDGEMIQRICETIKQRTLKRRSRS